MYDADIGGICGWRRFPKASERFPLPASRPAHRFPAPLSAHLVIANCTNTQHAHSTQTHRAHRVGMLCWLIAIFPAPPTSGRGRLGSTDCHRATPHMCSLPLLSSLALSNVRISPRSITSMASRGFDASLPHIINLQLRVFLANTSLFLRHLKNSIDSPSNIFWELAIVVTI